jgi:TPR repeat protein
MGKKAQAGKPKKLTPKDIGKRLDVLVKKLEEELKSADLFAPLSPTEDCAICLVPLSRVANNSVYWGCCGNVICVACYKENKESINKQNEEKNSGKKIALTCPFCRELEVTSDEEYLRQLQARCLQGDHDAFTLMGHLYRRGEGGVPKDDLKALDCFIQAVELGSPEACTCIAKCHYEGNGVAVNQERSSLFDRIGALRENFQSRHNIGLYEYRDLGNHEIGIRHWKIAVEAGHQDSLNELRGIYNDDGKKPGKEFISKEYMDKVYRVCHEAQEEVKSEEREKHYAFLEELAKMQS